MITYPGLRLLIAPTCEPVTDAELAMHLRLSDQSEYPLLRQYITASRMLFEEMTGLALHKQQWEVYYHRHQRYHFHEWQWWEAIDDVHTHYKYRLPKSPVQSIVQVVGEDIRQPYFLDNTVEPAILSLTKDVQWAKVTFWAGFECDDKRPPFPPNWEREHEWHKLHRLPAPIKQAILLQAASYFLHREEQYPGSLTNVSNGFKQIVDIYRVRL